MHPDVYSEFIAEFNRECNRLAASEDPQRKIKYAQELRETENELSGSRYADLASGAFFDHWR
jgi:hypothetical protein